MPKTFAVIGVGHIARAFLGALFAGTGKAAIGPDSVILWNRTAEHISDLVAAGCRVAASPAEAFFAADIVFIGLKPQNYRVLLPGIAGERNNAAPRTVISPAAGVTTDTVSGLLFGCPVVRVMPNTPMQIGSGVTAVCRGKSVPDRDFELICRVFSQGGEILPLPEDAMDAVTAVTSSAVAYVYRFIEALTNAGTALGIDSPRLEECVTKTFNGAAKLLLSSGKPASELIAAVRSPNGTTEQALRIFDERNIDGVIYDAVNACANRAAQLGRDVSDS